ncbi:MAG: ABC transporter substrate-binding protein [Hyphomicrobiaceae bacterium]|nr:ABC transporter substrate-binding protein [Hyphomicrobiaceae bacterium]
MATAALALPTLASTAQADLIIPSLIYRTGPYAAGGIPWGNGFNDYFAMLNARDGGINGVRVDVRECETAYNTQQGVECYEANKEGALVMTPRSTGITYQLIPRASVDEIPIFTLGYGRTSATDGTTFPWVFNPPVTYWDGASVMINYIAEQVGGFENLAGKKIALVFHNSAYGKEPIRTLESLAETYGFELVQLPVDHPGQEQRATWLQIRRDQPDWVLMYGWGVMNQVAIQEAASIRYPMDHFIGVWWSGSENDVLPAGAGADGYLSATFSAAGTDFPVFAEIMTHVYDAGNGAGERERVGEVIYNRGLLEAVIISEAIRTAMELTGKTDDLTGADMRMGFEHLNITAERLAELGLEGFADPIAVACANHTGSGRAAIQQWDADTGTWSMVTDFIDPDHELIARLIAEDAEAYRTENSITATACN